MTKKKKTNWAILGAVAGLCAAPFTGGLSLGMSAACGGLGFVGGKVVESALDGGSDDDSLNQNLKAWKIQNEQWKAQMEANRAEVERLREERRKTEENIKKNDDEMDRLRSIINNPYSNDEEKKSARKRLIILETENEKLKRDNEKKAKEIAEKSKNTPPPSKPWSLGLPKLGFTDKVILAGGTVLLIYLLIPSEKKK